MNKTISRVLEDNDLLTFNEPHSIRGAESVVTISANDAVEYYLYKFPGEYITDQAILHDFIESRHAMLKNPEDFIVADY